MVKRWRSVALAAVVLAACTGAGTSNPATSSAPTTVDDDGQPDAVATTVSGPVDERLNELPDPSETQVVNTSFGRWTWTRHDTDVTTLDREYPFPDYPESEGLLPEGPWLGFDAVDIIVNENGEVAVAAMGHPGEQSPEAHKVSDAPSSPKVSDPPSSLYSWTSSNGTTWREFSPPISAGSTVGHIELEAAGERIALLAVGADGDTGSMWTMSESSWQQVQELGKGLVWWPGSVLAATPSGWMMAWTGPTDGEQCEVWVSLEGMAWERIDYAPFIGMPPDWNQAQASCFVAGEVIAARVDDFSQGTVWVGRFGP